jgi:hypothetical protein
MKKFVLTFILLIIISFQLHAQWFWQNPKPQGNTLNSVDFVNENLGWAVGEYGTILKTTDGGMEWLIKTS